jgi:hypothetical protein
LDRYKKKPAYKKAGPLNFKGKPSAIDKKNNYLAKVRLMLLQVNTRKVGFFL